MFIQRWHKLNFVKEDPLPEWHCPTCLAGLLKLLPDKLHSEGGTFYGFLTCQACAELVYVMGNVQEENHGYHPYLTDSYIDVYVDVYTPLYFNPTIPIFRVAEKCPELIKELINDAFIAFWISPSLCATRIRETIELLLKKNQDTEIVRKPVTLRKRIVQFESKDYDTAHGLLGIKWLSRTGTDMSRIQRYELLNAFELLEKAINSLY